MNEDLIQRAVILIDQGRFEDAERYLRNALSEDPDNSGLMAMLSEATLRQDKNEEALRLIDNAIRLSPPDGELYSIKARVLIHFSRFNEAEECIRQSLDSDPVNGQAFAILAFIQLSTGRFQDALDMSGKALKFNPGNLFALNTRSNALLKLRKKEESFRTIKDALKEDPNNAYTHANYGWGLLETGNYKKALEHFKEALKSDPNNQYAREGMKEALKARYILYMFFLKYTFWLSRLSKPKQWMFIIGFFLLTVFIRNLASGVESTSLSTLFFLVYFGIPFFTWVVTPVTNLFLRFNPYGRYLLNDNETLNSNFVACSFTMGVVGFLLYLTLGDGYFLTITFFGLLMSIPFSTLFINGKKQFEVAAYVITLLIVGLISCAHSYVYGVSFTGWAFVFNIGIILFQLRITDLTINAAG